MKWFVLVAHGDPAPDGGKGPPMSGGEWRSFFAGSRAEALEAAIGPEGVLAPEDVLKEGVRVQLVAADCEVGCSDCAEWARLEMAKRAIAEGP